MSRRPTRGSIPPTVRAVGLLVLASAALGALCLASPSAAIDLAGRTSATISWGAASGPVVGYQVFVGRNGSRPSAPEQSVATAEATVSAAVGDSVVVWVQAYDVAGNLGPASPDSVALRFVPAAGTPPTPLVTPASFALSAARGSNPAAARLSLRNVGTGTLSWSVTSSATWLAPSPATGSTTSETDTISLDVSSSGLAVGSYAATLTFRNTETQATWQVVLTLAVVHTTPSLAVDATRLSATATAGLPAQTLGLILRNAGIGTLSWVVSDSAPWLLVSPTTGTSTGESDLVTLSFHTVDLAPGTYTATVAVSAAGATPSLQQIPLTLQLLPGASVQTSVQSLALGTAYGHPPPDQALLLRVSGGTERAWNVESSAAWLVPSPAAGTSAGEDDTVTLHFSSETLPPGEQSATLRITSAGVETKEVPVRLRVRPPAGDADGDGTSEAFLWNASGGRLLAYGHILDGQARGYLLPSGRPSDWQLLVSGDYDGDGSVDLLWRHRATGAIGVCLMRAVAISSCGAPFTMPASRTLLGSADYDGDGRADVAFRDPVTGAVEACFMRGLAPAFCLPIASFPASWRVTATGDFDRDGRAELIGQDPLASRLQLCSVAGPAVGTCQQPIALLGGDIVSTGDYDGDGRADLLWLTRPGAMLVLEFWTPTGWATFRCLGRVPANAEIMGSSDVDGDGVSDILVRDPATGVVDVWLVGAGGLVEVRSLGPLGLDFVLGGSSPVQ